MGLLTCWIKVWARGSRLLLCCLPCWVFCWASVGYASEAQLAALQQQSALLEQQFDNNQAAIEQKRALYEQRLGGLRPLFAQLAATAETVQTQLSSSVTAAQYPERDQRFERLKAQLNVERVGQTGDDGALLLVAELERFWFELHRELTSSAEVVRFEGRVDANAEQEITRVGLLNLISDDQYLMFDSELGQAVALQPLPRHLSEGALRLSKAQEGVMTPVAIDPSGAVGSDLLISLTRRPTVLERWHQGGAVGYAITLVGILGLAIALWQAVRVYRAGRRLDSIKERFMAVVAKHAEYDLDTVDIKLSEAVFAESAKVERGLPILKVIAVAAPLMGLLGTVVGMIAVFQALTLSGASDPTAMAGGISRALVTTVLGLLVAIPTLFLHTLLSSRVKQFVQSLEEQSMVALANVAMVHATGASASSDTRTSMATELLKAG